MDRKRILCVEDNEEISARNIQILEKNGYLAIPMGTLAKARAFLAAQTIDLILLDILLPDGSGLDFLKELRQTSDIPVLLLTGLSADEDVVRGLVLGGDDYLAKPYSFSVLLARVDALLRRSAHVPQALTKDGLKMDITSGQAFLHNVDMLLTQKEFSLLLILMQNEGKIMSAELLYKKAWKTDMNDNPNTVRYHIYHLRKKLEGSGYTITMQRGEGYCFERE